MVNRNLIPLLFFFFPIGVFAQEALQLQPSPLAMATARYKDAYLKITYSSPHKRGREIFGKLVPYGQIWRTGANQATELTATRDLQINGSLLKAGTYSLFTIPDREKWTVVLNSDLGLWGSYNYNPKMDVMRFEVSVQNSGGLVYEPFTIVVQPKNDKADIILLWDRTRVSFPVQFLEPKP